MIFLKNAWMLKSKPYPEMIKIISQLIKHHGLKLAVVSKVGRERNDIKMKGFNLNDFVDFFIYSCFSHLHKSDLDIYSDANVCRTGCDGAYIIYR